MPTASTADGVGRDRRARALRAGDVVLVRPGGRVPADGEIVDGDAELDESMITGESQPVAKAPGDRVVAGTVSTDSAIRVRVDAVGEDTALAGIQRLVAEAQAVQSPAPRSSPTGPPPCSSTSPPAPRSITFVVWLALGDPDEAVVRIVTVLVIACPHALGLAIPLTSSLSSAAVGRASGILDQGPAGAGARCRTVDAVLFDKTGTLTKGEHTVTGVAGVGTRRGRGAAPRRRPSSPTASTRSPGPSSPPPATAATIATRHRVPIPHRTRRRSRRRRHSATPSADPPCCANAALTEPRRSSTTASAGWKQRGAAVLYLLRGERSRRRARARGRDPTRGPRRRRRAARARRARGR